MVRRIGRAEWFLLLMAASVFVAGSSWAQSVHEATLTGTIFLPTGEALAGATVKISSPSLVTGERAVVSSEGGKFVFLSLPPGTYDLSASLAGFKTFSTPGIVLTSDSKVDLRIDMEMGAVEEEILVTGVAPVVDTRSSTIDTVFTSALLDKVPTARNAFYDLALTAPGMASVGADEGWLTSPSAFGSAANENIFLVNGVNTTNPRGAPWGSLVNVNYNTVEEVKVLSLGSKAEYGSFSGAAIDVLTKSGGNEFHGDVAYFTQLGNAADNYTLDYGSSWLYADPADDLTTEPVDSWDASVTLGGPIMKDKLWFYFGYSHNESETDTPLWIPLSTWEADLYDLKLTGDFGVNHRGWLGAHIEDALAGNVTWGQTWDPSMRYDQGRDNTTLQLQYQWVVSDRDIASVKYLGFDTEESPKTSNELGHPGYINWWKWIGTQSIGLNGDFPYVEKQISDRKTIQADFTHYADEFLGEHDLKFGVQYTKAEGNWNGGYFHGYANFAYPYPWDYGPAENWWWNCDEDWCWGTDEDPVFPMYNRKVIRNPWLTVRKSDSLGAFADDTWVLNDRVTLNVGLRYDRMTAKYGEGAVYEMPEDPSDINNPTFLRKRAGTDNVFDFRTWSPRIGVAWTLTEDQKTVLRAHIGRYYAPMGVEALRRFGPDMEPTQTDTWLYLLPMSEVDLNGNGLIDFDEMRPATRLLHSREPDRLQASSITDPSWELEVESGTTSPYTDQFNISLQRQLGKDISIEATYIYKKTEDLLALRPYNTETGQFYEWESVPFTTWTGYDTSVWQIVLEDYNGDSVTDVEDARFVVDHSAYRAINASSFNGKSVDRTYQGIQLVLQKRYADRWQMMAALNWTDTDGFYPRPVDQNWYIDGPLVMDTPFGSSYNHYQNNLEGPALMTPQWMFKLAGNYTIPVIETDIGLRVRYDSGRAIFPIQSIPTFQTWMSDIQQGVYLATNWGEEMVADDPNNNDWLPSTTIFDISLSRSIPLGDIGQLWISLDTLNALNEDSPNRVGFYQGDYGRVYSLVQPRTYRLGLKFSF